MLHLAQNGTKSQREFQRRALGNKSITKQDILDMQEILKKSGSYDYVMKLGWDYVKRGRE